MLYTDLYEVKGVLGVDPRNPAEDKQLLFYIEYASRLMEEFLGRSLEYQTRTEYYSGMGTYKLLLRHRPVYKTGLDVRVDETGYFGSRSGSFSSTSALTYGTHYCLQLDQPDGETSRSGILLRINQFWPRPIFRERGWLAPYAGDSTGNVKVTYSAGYTLDTLPADLRLACSTLVARLRYVMPLGMEMASESYEDRSITLLPGREYLLSLVKPMLMQYRNWKF